MSDFLLPRLKQKRKRRDPIVSITAYDYFTALLAREIDADFVLVGDSLGNVVQGSQTTVGVNLDEVIYHTKIVCRHFPPNRVVLDMPFGTFKVDADETVANCVKAFKATGCGAVKFEGVTNDNLFAINTLTEIGVPVLGHIGLQPQRVHSDGGFKVQGKTPEQARAIMEEAKALDQAGVFAIVLECVVPELAAQITASVKVPTIGIGSGRDCDGQIIVVHDILGMLPGHVPSFVKQYANLFETATDAVRQYSTAVEERSFPPLGRSKRKLAGVYGSDGDNQDN